MITEVAHFAFIMAFVVAGMMAAGGLWRSPDIAKRSAITLLALTIIAFLGLEWAYITSDFTVLNTVLNSHSQKPLLYKISGVWGNHEGSMLLWIVILSLFGAGIALSPHIRDETLRQRALGVQGLIAMGFIAFSLFTSNPFARVFPAPADGNSLNPVLQDIGLALHPPALYLGYVGFSSVFSLAAGALIVGRVDQAFAKAVKPFVAIAWLALTIGIAMGSRWAYYELGWGGWWYWDPVENASLLPWLAGTALLHSLLVLEARGALKRWTILLAIIAFAMSLLGTFLVRSGVLSSIHAFAVDPLRGSFILALLIACCGGAFGLYAWRAPQLKTLRLFTPVSRESSLVANNLLLITIAATVLTGTLYPLVMDTLGLAQISVGAPYYNATVLRIAIPLIILMGIGPFLPWKRPGRWAFKGPMLTCLLLTALAMLFIRVNMLGFAIAIWLMVASLAQIKWPLTLKNLSLVLGHFGLGLAIVGMIGTMAMKIEDIRIVNPGDTFTVGRHELRFDGVSNVFGPNYGAEEARITLGTDILKPQKRWYPVSDSQTTEAAIRTYILDDIYVVLGERDLKSGPDAWVVRTTVHPFVAALWFGFGLVALAGVLMLINSWRRR
jgi:cytochrome c-type biogenesis protein CcmF